MFRLLQESHFGGSRELFVERDDLTRAVGEAHLDDQLIRKTAAVGASGFEGLAGEGGGFDGEAAGTEQAFEGGEDPVRAPAGTETQESSARTMRGRKEPPLIALQRLRGGPLCLGGVIVEEGARPDVGAGDDHRAASPGFGSVHLVKSHDRTGIAGSVGPLPRGPRVPWRMG